MIKKIVINSVPKLYVGMPGIGKTQKILQQYDYVEVMLASSMVEEDIAGIPYREGKYDIRTIPSAIRKLEEAANEGKTTALFLDELDKARRSVADTLLTLVASRKIGDVKLPETTDIVAAANPPEWGGGDGVSDAMLSRFAIINVEPNVSEWVKWARNRYTQASETINKIIKAIEVGEIIIADVSGEDFSKRITSPRTIAMALDYIQLEKEDAESVINGLLTPVVARQVINIINKADSSLNRKAAVTRQKAEQKTFQPVRL